MSSHRQLQLAIDSASTMDALKIADEVYPNFDIAEVGTPLLIEEGLHALETLKKKYPGKTYLADVKITDAGYIEASSAFKRGGDIVTVLGVSDDVTISAVVKAAGQYHGRVMADMLHVKDQPERARQLEALGIDIICLHTAWDLKDTGIDPLRALVGVRRSVRCEIAVAGGLTMENVGDAVEKGADILVVGAGITKADNPKETAAQIMEIIAEV